MKFDTLIEAFLERGEFEEGRPRRITCAPWIESFEDKAGVKFPKAFRRLVTRYSFPEFEAGPLWFFANDGESDYDLVRRIVVDPVIAAVTRSNGLLHFARPYDGSYDPVCFDMRAGPKAAIVRLDHEAILMGEKIVITAGIAASFEALMRDHIGK